VSSEQPQRCTSLDAAKAAIGYERPRMSTTKIKVKRIEDMSEDELASFIAALEALDREDEEGIRLPGSGGAGRTRH
jgi:hypothetical protein